jgi:homoserine kinase
VADAAEVRVPATSANLGPGFDSLGLALGIHDDVTVRAGTSSGASVEVTGEGADTLPTGEDHLVVRAIRMGLEAAGAPQVGLSLTCVNRIPHGRGLGSSAAASVAGLLAARALVPPAVAEPGGPLDDDAVLALATELEGHPDNAAPALLGGATVAWTDDELGPRAARLRLDESLRVTVFVPATTLSTRLARGALPATVPHAVAARNAGRAALLVHALGGARDLFLPGTVDALHQEARRDQMPQTLALVDTLRDRGVPAVVSGAGPTVLAFATLGDQEAAAIAADGWDVRTPSIDLTGAAARPLA